LRGLSRPLLNLAPCLAHVTPIKADSSKEDNMTVGELALLISSIAQLIASCVAAISAKRRKR
jgi:hypothetical protein